MTAVTPTAQNPPLFATTVAMTGIQELGSSTTAVAAQVIVLPTRLRQDASSIVVLD